jgi:biotin carboxyl carrier protein
VRYIVTVAGREMKVDLDGDQIRVDGRAVTASIARVPGTPELRLTLDGHSHVVAIEGRDGGHWRLVEAGAVREIGIEDERARHIRSLAGEGRSQASSGVLKAPMPGLVVRIAVQEGDSVAAGASLVVLEAMKMENELKAPTAGTVGAIRVSAGQAVEKGQVLLLLVPAPV